MMRVLYLAHRVPFPPNKGDKIRAFHQICGLAARGHDVHVAAFADDPRDLVYGAELARLCRSATVLPLSRHRAALRSLAGLVGRQSLSVRYFDTKAMRAQVRRLIETIDPDAIVVYSSTMAQYVPRHLAARTVVDLVDVDSEKWREYGRSARAPLSWLYRLEGRRLRAHEHEIITSFARSILTTEREARLLDTPLMPRSPRLHTLVNGVDLQYYRPEASTPPPASRALVFVGAMDYHANVDGVKHFANHVFPLIQQSEPEAEFVIVGRNPTASVTRLARRPGVRVTGAVDDTRPYLANAAAVVVPLRIARGVQNKVFEAMALGCAVVATPEAVAGLSAVDGRELLIGPSPGTFANATLRILRDGDLRRRLGQQARLFVEREHQWQPMLDRFASLVEEVGEEGIHA